MTPSDTEHLRKLATFVRHNILRATNQADSGHPTSSLSAVELMIGLMFSGVFHYDIKAPNHPNNDRLIFSKGHASPLFYALWAAADAIPADEMLTYRQFGSRLEGHPTLSFPYTEAATGSLGQGLSIGVGMALNAKYLDDLPYRTYVLLGDSEMAEGSQWEAIQIASQYQLNNVVGILDVNRLGQRGETMLGHDIDTYQRRISAFGWETVVLEDGHSLTGIVDAYRHSLEASDRPTMIIARTIKGKGVPSVEDANDYHGKSLGKDATAEAEATWEELDTSVRGVIPPPEDQRPVTVKAKTAQALQYSVGDEAATRDAYGSALVRLRPRIPEIVVLDGEVSNSTRAAKFREEYPDRFFEMYIAEQNMAGVALGLSRRGKRPFASSFAAFWTRAYDQIRMNSYSSPGIVFAGSHAGTSIGKDGPSQMGLEDIAAFRSVLGSTVLYPCDAVSTERLVEAAADRDGIVYVRLTRSKTPVLYGGDETFPIPGAKILRKSPEDTVTIVTAGHTVHEALKAADELSHAQAIAVRVIDVYSVKPLDAVALEEALEQTGWIIVVEDHHAEGGIGEAVFNALRGRPGRLDHLAVTKKPGSGRSDEVLRDQGLTSDAIGALIVRQLVRRAPD